VCPGGKGCKYKHALPQGYIMKSEMQALLALERKEEKSLEEVTEEQRSTIRAATPINEVHPAHGLHPPPASVRLKPVEAATCERTGRATRKGAPLARQTAFKTDLIILSRPMTLLQLHGLPYRRYNARSAWQNANKLTAFASVKYPQEGHSRELCYTPLPIRASDL
jgi:hypothetical protein